MSTWLLNKDLKVEGEGWEGHVIVFWVAGTACAKALGQGQANILEGQQGGLFGGSQESEGEGAGQAGPVGRQGGLWSLR